MELVNSADHSPNHPGAYADFLNWAADVVSDVEKYDDLTDAQKHLITRAALDPDNLKNINGKLAKGVELVIEKAGDAFAIVRKQGGKGLAIGGAMKLGGKWVMKPLQKALPVIGFFTAVGAATKAFAETRSYDAAFVAAGREVFMADLVEAPFNVFAQVMGDVTGLDARRPGTRSFNEIADDAAKANRMRFPEAQWEKDVKRTFRNVTRDIGNWFRDIFD